MATWSKDFLVEFIEQFRGHPCIWKVKSKEYHNREMKENAYLALTEKMKTADPQANKETVLKKINNLRSSFRKERKKVLMAKKSGMSSEDLYVPKLWYDKDLLFLVDQEEALDGFSSLVSDTEIAELVQQKTGARGKNAIPLECKEGTVREEATSGKPKEETVHEETAENQGTEADETLVDPSPNSVAPLEGKQHQEIRMSTRKRKLPEKLSKDFL
ncbi:hypothetical protein B7P43_G06162 [Cryptotermes secundus]|uniref:MADF domain-containing protein n=1 Tax=Cryptotermes secundus TaxID=105785 RepID=A0A2J7QQE5_9NEOP|nr:hypothetical protein B7P43_G06162 [Cryptotermes secundus]